MQKIKDFLSGMLVVTLFFGITILVPLALVSTVISVINMW